MKYLSYGTLAAMFLIACQAKQYFTSSPEIDLVKKANDAYFRGDWETFRSIFSDEARVWYNAPRLKKTVITPGQLVDTLKAEIAHYLEYREGENPAYESPLYEMIVDDEGGKWVHCWFTWIGKSKNGNDVVTPVHLSSHIKENKIVIHFIYFNALPGYRATQPSGSTTVSE